MIGTVYHGVIEVTFKATTQEVANSYLAIVAERIKNNEVAVMRSRVEGWAEPDEEEVDDDF